MSSKWRATTLGEVSTWASGGTPKKDEPTYWGGDIPWISATSMHVTRFFESDLTLTEAGLKNGSRLASKDTVLLLVRGSALHSRLPVGIALRDLAFNQDVKGITVKADQIRPWYLLYWLMGNEKFILDSVVEFTGIGAGKLDTKRMQGLDLMLPPLAVQDEILESVKSIDDRITLLRETNTTLEAIAQALFKSWFVDFDPVHAKMQGRASEGMDEATAALFPESFEESELGLVPKGWKFGSLSDLCVIASGKRPVDRSDVLSDSCNIPLYGGAGVMGYTSESLFEDKKIVTGRVGTLGRVHVAYPPFWASDNVLVLSPRDETFFSFSFQWLCGIDVHALNRGSTQPLLTQKDLGAQVNVIPPRTLLEKFEEILAALNQQIRLQTLQIETLTNLRDTLLPRLISGELRASSIAGDAA